MSHANRQIEAHLRLGKSLHGGGRLNEAGQVYQQVLAVAPAHPDALHMMGVLILQSGRPAEGLGWIERAIQIKGSVAEFHLHRAHALLILGRAAEAAAASRQASRLKRGYAEAHQVLGRALIDGGDYAGSLRAYQDAARLKPDLPDLANNLGTALHHNNRLDDAVRVLTRAAARDPKDPAPLTNLSSVLKDLGRFAEAGQRLTAALRLAPRDAPALYNQALLLLLQGRFAEAWPGWEERFRSGAIPARGLAKPVWRGEPLAGRVLLVHAEQGLGDTIQFCRYDFPTDGQVVFEVQPRIAGLIASRPNAPRIVRQGDPLPAHDLTFPLMSLPAVRGTTLDTIPAGIPYLAAEPDAVERWRARLGSRGFRIGIAWQGNPTRREDTGRSIPLESYLGLASVPGTRLISLQKDDGAGQLSADMPVESLGADFDPGPDGFIDTAAAMMNLDLIVTSDTAIAHLAGALGRPVWVALRAVPDWRWMLERADSPWYPSMRLFRQTVRDDWRPVFAAMHDALAALVDGRSEVEGGNG